ncbi:junctional sarcoplasmic reticulum protein 1 [Amia ocellicauda]|uniref:junctional sarcoplasmic reticulum protein 1 n=1 Tax=Amia ocellicauda TaxID=2972642 RepID=UPI003463F7CA
MAKSTGTCPCPSGCEGRPQGGREGGELQDARRPHETHAHSLPHGPTAQPAYSPVLMEESVFETFEGDMGSEELLEELLAQEAQETQEAPDPLAPQTPTPPQPRKQTRSPDVPTPKKSKEEHLHQPRVEEGEEFVEAVEAVETKPPPRPPPPKEKPRHAPMRHAASTGSQLEAPWGGITLNRCLLVAMVIVLISSGCQRLQDALDFWEDDPHTLEVGVLPACISVVEDRAAELPETSIWDYMLWWNWVAEEDEADEAEKSEAEAPWTAEPRRRRRGEEEEGGGRGHIRRRNLSGKGLLKSKEEHGKRGRREERENVKGKEEKEKEKKKEGKADKKRQWEERQKERKLERKQMPPSAHGKLEEERGMKAHRFIFGNKFTRKGKAEHSPQKTGKKGSDGKKVKKDVKKKT